jgi:hypothetical protein
LPYLSTIVASKLTATDEDWNSLASGLDHQIFGVLVLAGMLEGSLMMGSLMMSWLMMSSLMVEVFSVSKSGTSIDCMLFFAIAVNALSTLYTAVSYYSL